MIAKWKVRKSSYSGRFCFLARIAAVGFAQIDQALSSEPGRLSVSAIRNLLMTQTPEIDMHEKIEPPLATASVTIDGRKCFRDLPSYPGRQLVSMVAISGKNSVGRGFQLIGQNRAVAVIPCNDLEKSEAFYRLLGFDRDPDGTDYGDYVILHEPGGAEIHLTKAPDGWLIPSRSPFGIYFYASNVDELASRLDGKVLHPPKKQPWGLYEFAASDPDENLVRVGSPVGGT